MWGYNVAHAQTSLPLALSAWRVFSGSRSLMTDSYCSSSLGIFNKNCPRVPSEISYKTSMSVCSAVISFQWKTKCFGLILLIGFIFIITTKFSLITPHYQMWLIFL